jgi:NADPH:quinone reductase-like Zn-dependent oxidoreductase
MMCVVRLRAPGGPEQLAVEEADRPRPGPGEALVRVHAAAITRDELQWPADRLPAIPSYELAGVVEEAGPGVAGVAPGDDVFALTPFDRDGVAADYAVVPADTLLSGRGVLATNRQPAKKNPFQPDALSELEGAETAW